MHNAQLKELSPKGMLYTTANFGYFPYGKTIRGLVQHASPSEACTNLQPLDIGYSILIADRGNCSAVTKAFYAQASGANMLIIVDEEISWWHFNNLYDDGSGRQLNIPILVISHKDGNILKNFTTWNDEPVEFSVHFEKPPEQKISEVEYWFSTVDRSTYRFFNNFRNFYAELHDQINFSPHIVVFENKTAAETNFQCQDCDHCLGGGRYCHPDHEKLNEKITGQDALHLDLLSVCNWRTIQNKTLYFDIMLSFSKYCLKKTKNQDRYNDLKSCYRKQMTKFGVSYRDAENCVTDSFNSLDAYGVQTNAILQTEMNLFNEEVVKVYPEMYVNKYPIKGDLRKVEIQNAVCSGYQEKHYPAHCSHLFKYTPELIENHTMPGWEVSVIVLSVFFMMIAISCYLSRKNSRKTQSDVEQSISKAVSQYLQMKEQNDSHSKSQNME